MKKWMAILFFVLLVHTSIQAQTADSLFGEKSASYCLPRATLQELFHLSKGQVGTIQLSRDLSISITLNMHEKSATEVETIGGTIAGYPEAFIVLSRYNDHGNTQFEGELSSKRYPVAYRIVLQSNGSICFEKISRSAIIVED